MVTFSSTARLIKDSYLGSTLGYLGKYSILLTNGDLFGRYKTKQEAIKNAKIHGLNLI
jgi:hypothetical protein